LPACPHPDGSARSSQASGFQPAFSVRPYGRLGELVGPLNLLLKAIFDRARPSYDGTIAMGGFSYPSGHAASAAALGTILLLVFWPVLSRAGRLVLVVLMIVGVAVVGYTRVALGANFLSDVVAGWSVGIAVILLLAVMLRVWPGQPDALRVRLIF
jgi:membrane-associated phospholipid phosphatase